MGKKRKEEIVIEEGNGEINRNHEQEEVKDNG